MARSAQVERWFKIVCLLPLVALVSVYAEAIAAARVLGHWPIPSVNDPKDLATGPLHLISSVLVLAQLPLFVFVLTVLIKSYRTLVRPSAYWFWIAVFLGGYVITHLLGRSDPGNVWYWWWD